VGQLQLSTNELPRGEHGEKGNHHSAGYALQHRDNLESAFWPIVTVSHCCKGDAAKVNETRTRDAEANGFDL
jgi:hypothetical protein